MNAKEFFLITLSPSQPAINAPIILNNPISARDHPAISNERPFDIKSLGRCKDIKVTWKPQVKYPKFNKI